MAMAIDTETCSTCGDCKAACPTGSIVSRKGLYSINADTCDECDGVPECVSACSADCIHPA